MHSAAVSSCPSSISPRATNSTCTSLCINHGCSFQRIQVGKLVGKLRPAKISGATISIRVNASCGCSSDILVVNRSSLYRPGAIGSSGVPLLAWRPADNRQSLARAGEQSHLVCGIKPFSQSALCEGSEISRRVEASRGDWCFQGDHFYSSNSTTTSQRFSQTGVIARDSIGFEHLTRTLENRSRGRRVRDKSSATFCTSAVVSASRVGLLAGKMELFKSQLVERVPFQFLSEYHAKPRVAGAAAPRRDSMNSVCFFGMGQQTKPVVEIVQAGDPTLREPAAEVQKEEIGSARIGKIINDMVATMRNAPGVGLAAPQIGIPLQIIVLEDTTEYMRSSSQEECDEQQRYPFDLLVIVNPKLKIKTGSGRAIFFEGCLSVNGYRALVERHLEVEVTGLGRDGRPISVEASGWKARILQHECDHLAGNLYVDKMISRSFRTQDQLRLPLPSGCPEPGVCKTSKERLR